MKAQGRFFSANLSLLLATAFLFLTFESAKADLSDFNPQEIDTSLEMLINGGKPVKDDDDLAYFVVAISTENGTPFCTGSIVDKDLILTAAHCLGPNMHVTFGVDTSDPDAIIKVSDAAAFPRFKKRKMDRHDIALLYLENGIPEGFEPVKVMPMNMHLTQDEKVVIAGYGKDNGRKDGLLKYTTVKRIAFPGAKNEYRFESKPQAGACYGDSGGPAVVEYQNEYFIAGVTSRGGKNCRGYSVYTKANSYWPWMRTAAREFRSANLGHPTLAN